MKKPDVDAVLTTWPRSLWRHAARRMYEGAGLGPEDVDIFNPYDGYAPMTQFFLEAFQWHGVKRGDAFAFYAGDIRVERPHPLCSSGGDGLTRCVERSKTPIGKWLALSDR
jgi:hypothetical protein